MPFLKLFISLTLAFAALEAKANNQEPVALSGKYEMKLTIGEKVFTDYMTIEAPASLGNQDRFIEGSIEVPNIFTAPFSGSIYGIAPAKILMISFSIVAKENGQEFNVHYSAQIPRNLYDDVAQKKIAPTFTGEARLDGNKLMGTFTAVKIE